MLYELHQPSKLFSITMNFRKTLYRISHWESWTHIVKYIPLSPVWLWYCLRSRSVWFFTPSNPTLTFGGFEGERKKEMYDHLPPHTYPKSIYISPPLSFDEADALRINAGFSFPFAVKPDVGMMGFMFRKVCNEAEFRKYHAVMPVDYIIQELVDYPMEVSVFYYRFPNEQRGTITGFLKKEYLEVTGDGKSTLLELILGYQRVQYRIKEMKLKHANRLNEVLPAGEVFCLSPALNLSRGGRLVSLEHEKDNRLQKLFDDLSHYTKYFYYGRYDIKCNSVEELKNGNFSILEFNGSGAEPHHIYGNGYTLVQAYGIIIAHWHALFKISRQNNQKGIPYWTYTRGARFLKEAKRHFKMLKLLDENTELT